MLVNMQMYILEHIRLNRKQGRLESMHLRPVVQNKEKYEHLLAAGLNFDMSADEVLIYTADEVIFAEPGTDLWRETSEICMIVPGDCRIEIETFFLFKLMEGENEFAREHLQDFTLFEPYLPLF